MFSKDEIVAKVKKLLALGENKGATEAERERAITQAHKFLAKYNLEMSVVKANDSERTDGITTFTNNPANRRIANAIAKLYFCSYLHFRRSNKHMFIGKPENVEVAISIATWVIKTARKQAGVHSRANPEIPFSPFITSFMHGASDAISRKALEIIEARKDDKPSVPGTSLVLANVYSTEKAANDAYIQKMFGATQQGKARKRSVNAEGYFKGVKHGEGVNLNTQIR